jgi:hypothetical protein
MTSAVACVALLFSAARAADAATIRVPADQPTIQQAIDAAVNGDVVLVAPGTYPERIDFKGRIITVASEQGPELTIIDAGGAGTVVTFKSGETRNAILSGFTIRGGANLYTGAGVDVAFSSPTIRGNIIRENHGCTGVGVHSYFSSPRIEGNAIVKNAISGCTGGWGIGVYIGGNSTAEIVGNEISDNMGGAASGGGVALFAAGRATVIGNVIARNVTTGAGGCGWGGGIATANFVEAAIVNNLIVGNRACYGGAFHWRAVSGAATVLANNTIADNEASVSWPGVYASFVDSRNLLYNNIIRTQNGPALFCDNNSSTPSPTLNSNDLFNVQGAAYGGTCADQTGINGNISVDPLFAFAEGNDYQLRGDSPAIDAGNNSAPHIQPTDLAGNPRISSVAGAPDRIDIGAYEFLNYAPVADAGADQTVTCGADCRALVTLSGSGSDPDGDTLTFTWTGDAGTFTGPAVTISLSAGVHHFVLTARDQYGNSASDSVVVTVLDVTPPSIASVTATPSVLTNSSSHAMAAVVVSVSASDACGGTVTCRIVSVTSDEPQTGLGGGDIGPDWEITGALTVNLRAERWNKGDGRVYTITVECADEAGNTSTSTVTVVVPRR